MNRIKIALQRSGRLMESYGWLLDSLDINSDEPTRSLISKSKKYPVDIYWIRDEDIPILTARNICDFGIVGLNVLEEVGQGSKNIETLKGLGTSKCRLSFAVPENSEWLGISSLNNKRVATSYAYLLDKFLNKNNIKASPFYLSGSVEIAPKINVADAILDLVSSGKTLASNGLKEVLPIMESEAVLICSDKANAKSRELMLSFETSRER